MTATTPDPLDPLAGLDWDHLVQHERVHRSVYTSPAIFEAEMSRVFGATWSYLAHESQVPRPNDWRAAALGRRRVLLCRAADGSLHAMLDRCTHRGAQLTDGDAGCAKRFSCPYHGWTFANDGRLVAVPFPDAYGSEFDRSARGLGRVRIESYRGFVFATLNPDAPPLADYLGPATPWFDHLIDRHPGGRLAVTPTPIRQTFAGNWKLSWDNATDGLHATFAHRSYNGLGRDHAVSTVLDRDPASTPMYAKDLTGGHMVVDQRPGIPGGPWATMRPVPFSEELAAEHLTRPGSTPDDLDLATGSMVNLCLFPNLLFVGNQLLVVEPIAVDRTRLSMYLTVGDELSEPINELRVRVDEDFTNFGTPDDLDMFERVQIGLGVPEMEWVDVSRGVHGNCDRVADDGLLTGPITSEVAMRGYLREYRRLMRRAALLRAG